MSIERGDLCTHAPRFPTEPPTNAVDLHHPRLHFVDEDIDRRKRGRIDQAQSGLGLEAGAGLRFDDRPVARQGPTRRGHVAGGDWGAAEALADAVDEDAVRIGEKGGGWFLFVS